MNPPRHSCAGAGFFKMYRIPMPETLFRHMHSAFSQKKETPFRCLLHVPFFRSIAHGGTAVGAELAVRYRTADGAGFLSGNRLRRIVLCRLAGFQLRDLGLGGGDRVHQFPHRVGDLALILIDEPFTDGPVILVDLLLLAGQMATLSFTCSAASLVLSAATVATSFAILVRSSKKAISGYSFRGRAFPGTLYSLSRAMLDHAISIAHFPAERNRISICLHIVFNPSGGPFHRPAPLAVCRLAALCVLPGHKDMLAAAQAFQHRQSAPDAHRQSRQCGGAEGSGLHLSRPVHRAAAADPPASAS